MGTTTQTVSFFSDEITIKAHTASRASYLGRPITLAEFGRGKAISLERVLDGPDAGDYIARRFGFQGQHYGVAEEWLQGPEVSQ